MDNLNKQIDIYKQLKLNINSFRITVEKDRKDVSEVYNNLLDGQRNIHLKQLKTDKLLKLKLLEDKIENILDNIASAKQGILHPSILSGRDIIAIGLDFYKLKHSRVGLTIEHTIQ